MIARATKALRFGVSMAIIFFSLIPLAIGAYGIQLGLWLYGNRVTPKEKADLTDEAFRDIFEEYREARTGQDRDKEKRDKNTGMDL